MPMTFQDEWGPPATLRRYEAFTKAAVDNTKKGGNLEVAQVFAKLALAEATLMKG